MNQLSKRIIAGTMALAVVGSAAPISNYLGIKTEKNRRNKEKRTKCLSEKNNGNKSNGKIKKLFEFNL